MNFAKGVSDSMILIGAAVVVALSVATTAYNYFRWTGADSEVTRLNAEVNRLTGMYTDCSNQRQKSSDSVIFCHALRGRVEYMVEKGACPGMADFEFTRLK